MTAQELEDRTIAAEKEPGLIRQLITDFKAYKDGQLSDLTGQLNALTPTATFERDAIRARYDKLLAGAQEALAAGDYDSLKAILFPVVEEEKLTEKERKLAELDKRLAELTAERARVEAEATAVAEPIK